MGTLPTFLPGYQPIDDPHARAVFAECWQVEPPAKPGLTASETIFQAKAGIIKGLYITGENPLASFPHSALVKEALESLDFLVVQDLFLTETARQAKVVLPAASFAEKEGTFTNLEGKVQKIRQAIKPLGQSRPDWQIILQLAAALGHPMPFTSLEEVKEEMSELILFYENYANEKDVEEKEFWETGTTHRLPLRKFPGFSPAEYSTLPVETDDEFPLPF